MESYDDAAHKFYGGQNIQGYPLQSMDVYAKFFDKLSMNLLDIKGLTSLATDLKWQDINNFDEEILDKQHIIVVTDAQLKIVYATQNMVEMNGYLPHEVIGKSPKMFQGKSTCRTTTQTVSNAIKNRQPFEVILTNYRKNGTTYECHIKSTPIFDRKGKLVNFIAFEREVA